MSTTDRVAPTAKSDAASTSKKTSHWPDNDYKSLVTEADGYRVYIDDNNELQWETTDEYEKEVLTKNNYDSTKYFLLQGEADILSARAWSVLKGEMRREFLFLVGDVLVFNFECNYAAAEKVLASAQEFFKERSEEKSRSWYLLASLVMALAFMSVGIAAWHWRDAIQGLYGVTVFWLVMSSVAGAIGAVLSVIQRSGKMNLNPSAGRWIHYLEGACRIGAGAICAIVACLAVKSGLVLGTLTATNSNTVLILVAIASGTSERLATSIIAKIDSEDVKKSTK